jgi:aspartyl protease family protein
MTGHLRYLLFILAIIGAAALTVWIASQFFDVLRFDRSGPSAVFTLSLLALLGGRLLLFRDIRFRQVANAVLIWGAIGLLLVLGYSYRDDLTRLWNRIAGELSPGTTVTEGRSLRISRAHDGHFYADVAIDGRALRLLVDTGATNTVLSQREARAVGIDTAALDYRIRLATANGTITAAPVTVRSFEIGGASLRNLGILVSGATASDVSVLGIGTLNRFRGYQVRDGVLTLFW